MEQFCHTLPTSTAFENTWRIYKTVGVIRYTVPEIQTRALSVYVSNTSERSTKSCKGGQAFLKADNVYQDRVSVGGQPIRGDTLPA